MWGFEFSENDSQDLILQQQLELERLANHGKKSETINPDLIDPTPDIFALFVEFNKTYFWGKLGSVEVKWSSRMTLCAGLCEYSRGCCVVKLSEKLLQFRSRKELYETLLHEMIHAYLFVTHSHKDHDAHGPEFKQHMHRINSQGNYNITVYHNFIAEVAYFQQHHWQCQGKCGRTVKRATNRAPSTHDPWWAKHVHECGGTWLKVKEPPKMPKKLKESPSKKSLKRKREDEKPKGNSLLTSYFHPPDKKPKLDPEKDKDTPAELLKQEKEDTKDEMRQKMLTAVESRLAKLPLQGSKETPNPPSKVIIDLVNVDEADESDDDFPLIHKKKNKTIPSNSSTTSSPATTSISTSVNTSTYTNSTSSISTPRNTTTTNSNELAVDLTLDDNENLVEPIQCPICHVNVVDVNLHLDTAHP